MRESETENRPMEESAMLLSKNIRNISIDPLDYGFIVRVGCQSMAIESKEDVIKYLTEYLTNPNQTEEKYHKKELLKHQENLKGVKN